MSSPPNDAERLGTVRDAHLMCRCMPTPADGHDQKRRRAGAEYWIYYACDEHCPDPAILSPEDEIRRLVS